MSVARSEREKMPAQAPQWTEFLSCQVCYNVFNETDRRPVSLACGHTVCRTCLLNLPQKKCPFDQCAITRDVSELPVNYALLQLVGAAIPAESEQPAPIPIPEKSKHYESAKHCIEEIALYLKPISEGCTTAAAISSGSSSILSRPMQRKVVSLVSCQLVEEEGRARAARAARSLGERTVTELILQHQNAQQLSSNLWAAVRARGCQFLGPAMQEEVLKLILLALEDGSLLSRKVLVLFVVQRLEPQYPQASKTAIGHVVQLLYRASCFKVTKRDEESSLMQLKEEFRSYEALRREHDSQIIQIAMESGLRIAPDQWSSLLYGDTNHKSHMQSIIDKLQTPQSFTQSTNELVVALQRSGDPFNLQRLRPHLEFLASIDPSPEAPTPSWENLEAVMKAVKTVVKGLVDFIQSNGAKKVDNSAYVNVRYKTSMCRDLSEKGRCPRGTNCTFAHSQEELEKFRARNKRSGRNACPASDTSTLTLKQKVQLDHITRTSLEKQRQLSSSSSDPAIKDQNSIPPVAGAQDLTHGMNSLSVIDPVKVGDNNAMSAVHVHQPQINFQNLPPQPPVQPNVGSMVPPQFPMYPNQYHPSMLQSGIYPSAPQVPVGNGGVMMNMQGVGYSDMYQMEVNRGCVQHPSIPSPYPMMQQPQYPGVQYQQFVPGYFPPGYMPYTQNPGGIPPYMDSHSGVQGPVEVYLNDQTATSTSSSIAQDMGARAGGDVAPINQTRVLHNLRSRRQEILEKIQNIPASSGGGTVSNPLLKGCASVTPTVREIIKDPYKSSNDKFMLSTKSTLNKAVSDTLNANQITSLAEVQKSSWNQDYIPWSSGDTTLSVFTSSSDTMASSSDILTDSGDIWNESSSDSTEFMLNWLKDIPDDPVPVENKEDTKWWLNNTSISASLTTSTESRAMDSYPRSSMSVCSDKTDEEIPFDPPIVSKFGPISRSCKTKYKFSDPVQATANQGHSTMTPVTAITPVRRPQTTAFPQETKVKKSNEVHMHGYNLHAISTGCYDKSEMGLQDYVRHELSRLEKKAQNAYTEGEALNCELQAVELQISLEDGSMLEAPPNKPEKTIFGWELESKLERPPGAWSSFELLAAATTKGMKLDDIHMALDAQKKATQSLRSKQQED
ncbi:roquin-1-like isoform X1 [Saccostrea cucullata]|uniref:roquin-1-like isoform X1 n=1 Tax=Saccostrea cuccullata TaxID=36930 RepID=UPI002ED46676